MARKHLSITLVPDGGAVRTLRVPFALILGLLVCLASGVATVAGSGLVYFKSLKTKDGMKRLRAENLRLRDHVDQAGKRLTQLEGMVHRNEALEEQARILAGLDPIDGDTRRLGVGGPFVASGADALIDSEVSSLVDSQSERIEELIRRTTFQQESYMETIESLEQQAARMARTPTICPLQADYTISSGFGVRSDPFTGERGVHNGLDLRAPRGTPVYATATGEVVHAGYDGEFGMCVRIDHGEGVETLYCHLSATRVAVGETVKRGQQVGAVGSTGRSTGSHLHYEVHVDGAPKNPAHYILSETAGVE